MYFVVPPATSGQTSENTEKPVYFYIRHRGKLVKNLTRETVLQAIEQQLVNIETEYAIQEEGPWTSIAEFAQATRHQGRKSGWIRREKPRALLVSEHLSSIDLFICLIFLAIGGFVGFGLSFGGQIYRDVTIVDVVNKLNILVFMLTLVLSVRVARYVIFNIKVDG